MKAIALYGGSFDPPHIGHQAVIEAVLQNYAVKQLYVIPCRSVNGKNQEYLNSSAEQRLSLCRAAFQELKDVTVSSFETDREGPSYTADTVRHFRQNNPELPIFLIIGQDKLESLANWVDADYILSQCEILVAGRSCDTASDTRHTEYRILNNSRVDISSAEIREQLKRGGGVQYLNDSVYGLIVKQNLYDVRVNLDWLREKSYAFLKKKRIPHVEGCERTAVELAIKFGCDPHKAAKAAILHDITKKLDRNGQLLLCGKYDIICDDEELSNEKLLHSITGAYLARDLFGVEDDIFNAIRWHTTGKPNMTMLEKIIYLADYIEPTRDFPGVEELRREVYSDLDAGMALGLRMSLKEIQSYGVIPHKNSREAYAYYKERC